MKKFKFRYESVLKMRRDKEDQIKSELANCIAQMQEKENEKIKLEQSETEYALHVQTLLATGEIRAEMKQFSEGKKYYRNKKKRLDQQILELKHEIQRIQVILVEAMKDRKIMDKLKENAFQAFLESINEADEKLIEEVVNFSNNKRDGD